MSFVRYQEIDIWVKMVYTTEQRAKMVEFYLSTQSVTKTQRQYVRHFGTQKPPSRKMILYNVNKFRNRGTVHNLNSSGSGRQRGTRSAENVEEVRTSVLRSPIKSVRRRAQELGLPKSSLQRILRLDLHVFPYQVQVMQKLSENDKMRRVQMCEWFNGKMEDDPEWIKNVWFSDEAHFHLDGIVSSHNYRFWGSDAPQDFIAQKPLHSVKVTAWCALSHRGIIGPYWFEDENERAVAVNQENYRATVCKFSTSLRRRRNIPYETQWFQQDGATPHTAVATRELLRAKFADRVISFRTQHIWAPHSPDLNPLDFFLWGYAKDNVYRHNPVTVQDLKQEITQFIRRIPEDICQRVVENFAVRLNACKNKNGGHIEHIVHLPVRH